VTGRDYPVGVANRGGSGLTAIRLMIDPDGQVMDCQITQSSGSQILDNTACNLIKARARFRPARDGDGKNVAGTYSNRVRWALPDYERVARLGTVVKTVTVDLDKTGAIRKCEFTSSPSDVAQPPASDTPCSPFREGAEFAVIQDANGKAIDGRMIVETTIKFVPR
jgi:TonB family protein